MLGLCATPLGVQRASAGDTFANGRRSEPLRGLQPSDIGFHRATLSARLFLMAGMHFTAPSVARKPREPPRIRPHRTDEGTPYRHFYCENSQTRQKRCKAKAPYLPITH